MKRLVTLVILLLTACGSYAADPHADVGKQVYQKWCAPCRAPDDLHPGTLALRASTREHFPMHWSNAQI